MALTVGELVAYIRADGTQFDRTVDQSKGKFEGLGKVIGTGVKTIATGFAAATTAAAGLGISAFKIGADFNILQQNSRAALRTILGSAEAAADQMDRLDDFASNSPFARQVWITAQQQLLGFGVEAERVVPILDAVQQSVAAVGGNNEQIEAITFALAQMQGQGKLTGETFNQLGQYGIDAAGILGEQLGKTGAEIRELASKPGGIPVEEVWDPLVTGLMDRFDGATDGLRQQWDGAVDRIKAAWRDIGAILAAPFIDPMGGGRAVDWANDFADTLRAGQAKIKPFVDILVDRLEPSLDRITPAFEAAQGVINSWDLSQVNRQLDEMAQYGPLIAGVGTALFSMGTQSVPILRAINPIAAGFAALAATSPEVRTMLGDFLTSLQPLLPMLGTFATQVADIAVLVLSDLAPAFGDLLVAGGDLAVTLGGTLLPALGDLLAAGAPIVEVLATLLQWLAELPPEFQAAGIAVVALTTGPLGELVSTINGQVAGAFKVLREQTAVQSALAGTGEQATLLGTAAMNASGLVRGLGTAMKTAFIANAPALAIMAVVGAITAFAQAAAEARARAEEYEQTLDDLGNTTEATTEHIINQITKVQNENFLESIFGKGESIRDRATEFGIATETIVGYIRGEQDAIEDVDQALQAYIGQYPHLSREQGHAEERVRRFTSLLDDEADALGNGRDQAEAKAEANRELADSEQGAADGADAHREAQERLRDELNEGIDATLSAAEADLRYREAVDRTEGALRRHEEAQKDLEQVMGDTNATTEEQEAAQRRVEQSSRGVEQALIQQIRQVENDLAAKARNNATTEELTEIAEQAREDYIQLARQFGASAEEAERMADQFGLIPEDLVTRFRVDGFDDAEREITEFVNRNGNRQISIKVNTSTGTQVHFPGPGGGIVMNADGGVYDGTVRAFANGGIDHAGRPVARVPQIVQGGRNILWGEPETGWESYISGKPSARARNLAVMDETARRLGGFFVRPMADGGTTGRAAAEPARNGSGGGIHVPIHVDGAYDPRLVAVEVRAAVRDELARHAVTGGM